MTENEDGADHEDEADHVINYRHVTSRLHVTASATTRIPGRHAFIGLTDRGAVLGRILDGQILAGRILDLGRLDESDDDTEAVARAGDRDGTGIRDAKTGLEVMTIGVPWLQERWRM